MKVEVWDNAGHMMGTYSDGLGSPYSILVNMKVGDQLVYNGVIWKIIVIQYNFDRKAKILACSR